MDSVGITLKVIECIEEAIMNGYDRFYMMWMIWKLVMGFYVFLL